MKFSCINLTTTDPSFNLAAEQYIFDSLPRDRTYFMLWQNDNAIIIGKYQNTQAEINENYVREHGIHVVRRLSGGGAVYHDLGNLNFTFITDAGNTDILEFSRFCKPIVKTLDMIGVKAEINGRNDMTIDGKKFSGNSQYMKNGRVMHHGTIMFDSNLEILTQALNVDPTKIESKGMKSVRSHVTNVSDHLQEKMDIQSFRKILMQNISEEYNGSELTLTDDDLAAISKICNERYATWDWNYGESPECTFSKKKRIEGCGTVEVRLTIDHGLIEKMKFNGDFFSINDPSELAEHFIGLKPEPEVYSKVLKEIDISKYFSGMKNEDFFNLLSDIQM